MPEPIEDLAQYNGWRNRQTWAANLWLSNVESSYRAALRALEGVTDPHKAGARLRDVWRNVDAVAHSEARPSSLIDWDEIGAAWMERR